MTTTETRRTREKKKRQYGIFSVLQLCNVLHPQMEEKVPLFTLADGVWVWPNDLQLATDHVMLPEAFLTHLEQRGWTPTREGTLPFNCACN